MKRVLLVTVVFGLCLPQVLPQPATREEAIKQHQERINTIIKQSQQRREQQARDEALQQAARGTADVAVSPKDSSATGTLPVESPPALDDLEVRISEANWAKLKDFYYLQEVVFKEFKGSDQNYRDDALQLSWVLDSDKVSVQYRWLHTTATSEAMTSLEWLPTTATNASMSSRAGMRRPVVELILLRQGVECAMLFPAQTTQQLKIYRWQQPEVIHTTGDMSIKSRHNPVMFNKVSSPYIMVDKDHPQIVNEWTFSISADGGLVANQDGTTETVRIGSKFDDSRPVGRMYVRIYRAEPETGTYVFQVHNGGPDKTLFAATSTGEFLEAAQSNGRKTTVGDALASLGERYGFRTEYANEETQRLASAEEFQEPNVASENSLLLTELEKSFGTHYIPEIVDATTLRLHVTRQHQAEVIERPAMLSQLKASYKLDTRVYVLKRLLAKTAELLIQGKLGTYVVAPVRSLQEDSPVEILHSGSSYAIVKVPAGLNNPRGSAAPIPMISERGIADELSGSLIVTATPETHTEIAALLNKIDEGAKETALAADQPVPTRQRLQVVLLQGGKAGTATTLAGADPTTSATFDAAVPAAYGMTPDDLKMLGFDGAVELGRSLVRVVSDPGEMGESKLTLGGNYTISISYRDQRQPYLVLDAKLENDDSDVLAENSMMLEKGKPGFLGVTNLSGAIILAVTWVDEEAAPQL